MLRFRPLCLFALFLAFATLSLPAFADQRSDAIDAAINAQKAADDAAFYAKKARDEAYNNPDDSQAQSKASGAEYTAKKAQGYATQLQKKADGLPEHPYVQDGQ